MTSDHQYTTQWLDVCIETSDLIDALQQVQASLIDCQVVGVEVTAIQLRGPNGWPMVRLQGERSNVRRALVVWYGEIDGEEG